MRQAEGDRFVVEHAARHDVAAGDGLDALDRELAVLGALRHDHEPSAAQASDLWRSGTDVAPPGHEQVEPGDVRVVAEGVHERLDERRLPVGAASLQDRQLLLDDLADQADAGQALQERLQFLVAARDAVEERAVDRTLAPGRERCDGHARVQLAAIMGTQLAGAQVDDAARGVERPRPSSRSSAFVSTRASACATSIIAFSARI